MTEPPEPYIAHIREDGLTQSVYAHLTGTAERARAFASSFGAEADATLAGYLHDIGKYSDAFQRHICTPDDRARVDHSTAGAKAIGCISPVAFAIAGHHGGIPDGGSRADTADVSSLIGRLRKDVPDYSAWSREQTAPKGGMPAFLLHADPFAHAFYTRMLFSCLVDADYLDTEAFMQGDPGRGQYAQIPELLARLDGYTAQWAIAKNDLGMWRNMIREACDLAALGAKGLYTLTVPTGGGKTVSSLSFALRHAVRHGMRRMVYIVPYTSIIDQTACVFAEILGAENVIEHHSGMQYEDDQSCAPESYRKRLATENWDAPVIVTTAVQFFESLYANRPGKCRKLHNLADAVLIFDEAQTIPIPYLRPCVAAIAQLVQHYGATAVLCTATQPALDPIFAQYGLTAREICADRDQLYQFFRRTTYQLLGMIETRTLADRLNAHTQALCVVNRRKTARELYRLLHGEGNYCTAIANKTHPEGLEGRNPPNIILRAGFAGAQGFFSRSRLRRRRKIGSASPMRPEFSAENSAEGSVSTAIADEKVVSDCTGNYCLTTLIYPLERKRMIAEIRARLHAGLPCRVVATSLIEAGVDVDFPVAYRQEAGLDSIIQTGGRCNREGKRSPSESMVYVFALDEPDMAILALNISTTRSILNNHSDISDPATITEYFQFYRALKGDAALDRKSILPAFAGDINGCVFPFAQVARMFQLIETPARTVYIPKGDGAALTEDLLAGNVSRALFRKLDAYAVNVYPEHFRALYDAGAIHLLDGGDGVLTDVSLYDDKMGLTLDVETGKGFMI